MDNFLWFSLLESSANQGGSFPCGVHSWNQFKLLKIISYTDKEVYHNHIILSDCGESSGTCEAFDTY